MRRTLGDKRVLDFDSKNLLQEVQVELAEGRQFSIRASKRTRSRSPLLRSLRALQANSRLNFFDILRLGTKLACIGLIEESGDRRWKVEESDDELVVVVSEPNSSA